MQRITVTEEKKMTVAERKAAMPYEVAADGQVIAVVKAEDINMPTVKTKCPNCGLVYDAKKPDNKPNFLSVQHP